MQNAVYIMRK